MTIDVNNYTLLGVSPTVTPKELRQSYIHLLVTAHPDKGGSAERFAAIQKAYATLSDPTERAIYDEQLERRNKNKTNSSRSLTEPTSHGSVTTNSNGVTAHVHGQTSFPPERQDHHRLAGGATFAGQPSTDNASTNDSFTSISEKILALKKDSMHVSKLLLNQTKPTPTPEEILQRKKSLADLYTHRAALHFASGREHHAKFDVEEALRIWPECGEAEELLGKLKRRLSEVKKFSEGEY